MTSPPAQPSGSAAPAVVTRDLWKQYELGDTVVDALRGVTLELPPGRVVVFVGPSGSGKTTLLNLIGGLDVPTRGELSVLGQPLIGMTPEQLSAYRREWVGFVFQMFNLVPTLTALENVRLVAQLVGTDHLAERCLAEVGLADVRHHLPSQLSGGQQQRVAIARALVKQPRLLLADEPTGALDGKTGQEVLSVLWEQTRSRGMTALLVTHNREFARLGEIVVQLASGQVAEVGEGEGKHPRELEL